MLVLKWLADTAESAFFPRGNRRIEGGVGSNHDDDRVAVKLQKLFERAQAANAGHRNVEQHDVVGPLRVCVKAIFARLR